MWGLVHVHEALPPSVVCLGWRRGHGICLHHGASTRLCLPVTVIWPCSSHSPMCTSGILVRACILAMCIPLYLYPTLLYCPAGHGLVHVSPTCTFHPSHSRISYPCASALLRRRGAHHSRHALVGPSIAGKPSYERGILYLSNQHT